MAREYVVADEATDFTWYVARATDSMVAQCRDGDDVFWNIFVDYLGTGPEDMVEFHFNARFMDHVITRREAEWLATGKRASFYVNVKDLYGDGGSTRLLAVVSLQPSGLMTRDGNELLLVVAEELIGRDGSSMEWWRGLEYRDSPHGGDGGVIFGRVPDLGAEYASARSLLRELVSGLQTRLEEEMAAMRSDVALPSYYMNALVESVKVLGLCLEDGETPSVHEVYKVAGSVFKHLCRLGDHGCADQLDGLTRSFLSVGLKTGEVACDGEKDEKIVKALGL